MKRIGHLALCLLLMFVVLRPVTVWSHCQMPCGIYDDEARFTSLAEHIATIEKSMNQIKKLSAAGEINYNQLVRWIDNKDFQADDFMDIVTQYFMCQRVKPVDSSDKEKYEAYLRQVTLLHRMLVVAMECKQTIDLQHTAELSSLLKEFKGLYFK